MPDCQPHKMRAGLGGEIGDLQQGALLPAAGPSNGCVANLARNCVRPAFRQDYAASLANRWYGAIPLGQNWPFRIMCTA